MKYKTSPRQMLKTTDSYLSIGLLAAHNYAGWFNESGMNLMILPYLLGRYTEQYKLEEVNEELQEFEEKLKELQAATTRIKKTLDASVLTKKEEETEEELKYIITLKKKKIAALESKSVPITSSIAYIILKMCVFESILDYSMESSNSYMRVVATPFAFAFFCVFMEKMVFDRYQYKEDIEHGPEDCAPGKNKAMIFYFSLLQATTLASCNLAAYIITKRYGETISGGIKTVIPIPGIPRVIDAISTAIPIPRFCGVLINGLASAYLTRSDYTNEVDVDSFQMAR